MYAALTSVAMPMTAAPSMAPYAWPGPPRNTAARMSTRNRSVDVGAKLPASIAKTTPARPHSAPVSAHVMVMTRPVLIPQLRASALLAAVARIALPSFEWRSSMCTPAMTSTLRAMTTTCTTVRIRPPAFSVDPLLMEYETLVPPTYDATPNSMMSVIPSDTITSVIADVPRRWNGVYTPEFSSTDPREQTTTAANKPIQTDKPAWLT